MLITFQFEMYARTLGAFCALFISIKAQSDVGDGCMSRTDGRFGVCELITKCPSAINDIQLYQKFPQTCGFKGTVPIVCCMDKAAIETTSTTTTTTSTTNRPRVPNVPFTCTKCAEKCREYGKLAFKKERPPILLPGITETTTSTCSFAVKELVIGGEDAAPKEFPHMALVGYGTSDDIRWLCGGSLISEQYVLSAAHCGYHIEFGVPTWIRLGEHTISRDDDDAKPQQIAIAERIPYPDYTSRSRYHDILLLKLERPAVFNQWVRPACLHVERETNTEKVIATGWGYTENVGNPSDVLQKVTLDKFTTEECKRTFRTSSRLRDGIMGDRQMCAGSRDGNKDTCQGDSGGPVQIYNREVNCTYYVVGITSFGKSCGFENIPAVYSRVSYYVNWIENVIWP